MNWKLCTMTFKSFLLSLSTRYLHRKVQSKITECEEPSTIITKPISRSLFDLLAIGTRMAKIRVISKELSWWSDLDGGVLGAVTFDLIDHDFSWIILVRDRVGRFRCVDLEVSLSSEQLATLRLRNAMANKSRDPEFSGYEPQGDEPNKALDLLEDRGVPDEQLHPFYREIRDRLGRQPAKKVLSAISPWLLDFDPNLVKEFQESQFNQRLWEIYLWAMFRDQGYEVDHQKAPDLIVGSPWFRLAVEATTIASSTSGPLSDHPNPETPEEVAEFLSNYMPMKFGSSLTSKLKKVDASGRHYWEMPGIEDMPFTIALADFHKESDKAGPGSMTFSQGGLYPYLYGTRVSVEVHNEEMVFKNEPVTEHTYNGKTIPSGFFDLPNAGTIAKFDRIGVLAGFAPEGCKYYRIGFRYDSDPAAVRGIPFSSDVNDPEYEEYWGDEVQVFHNPRATRPLPLEALPDATHFFYDDKEPTVISHGGRILSSMTFVICNNNKIENLASSEE